MSSPSPARLVRELARAHIAARCLHVAATFGIADAIGEEPADPREIAKQTGVDADMYASVFAEDAEFTFGGKTYKGRDEIRKIVTDLKARRAAAQTADAPRSYHALSNTYIELVNDHEARHRSYWQTITGPSSGPFTVGGMGRYEDTLVKRNGTWLIQKRQIVQ